MFSEFESKQLWEKTNKHAEYTNKDWKSWEIFNEYADKIISSTKIGMLMLLIHIPTKVKKI